MRDRYFKRFFDAPADSFFIFGPRGTGKSTWRKKTFPDVYLIDLLDDRTFRNHVAYPERIKQIVTANPQIDGCHFFTGCGTQKWVDTFDCFGK